MSDGMAAIQMIITEYSADVFIVISKRPAVIMARAVAVETQPP